MGHLRGAETPAAGRPIGSAIAHRRLARAGTYLRRGTRRDPLSLLRLSPRLVTRASRG